MNYKNLIRHLPKIGIRPVIDGRLDGVRESLENSTMNMTKIAADLVSESLCFISKIYTSKSSNQKRQPLFTYKAGLNYRTSIFSFLKT